MATINIDKVVKHCAKIIFKLLCISVMCTQLINITFNYFQYPFEVQVYLEELKNDLPSVTLCFGNNAKCLFKNNKGIFFDLEKTLIVNKNAFSVTLSSDAIDCKINATNSQQLINCKSISNVKQTIRVTNADKCFTYFNKKELFETIPSINNIEFTLNNSYILNHKCTVKGNEW